jgi:hypothetical protein
MLHRAAHVTADQKIFVHALSGAVGGGASPARTAPGSSSLRHSLIDQTRRTASIWGCSVRLFE